MPQVEPYISSDIASGLYDPDLRSYRLPVDDAEGNEVATIKVDDTEPHVIKDPNTGQNTLVNYPITADGAASRINTALLEINANIKPIELPEPQEPLDEYVLYAGEGVYSKHEKFLAQNGVDFSTGSPVGHDQAYLAYDLEGQRRAFEDSLTEYWNEERIAAGEDPITIPVWIDEKLGEMVYVNPDTNRITTVNYQSFGNKEFLSDVALEMTASAMAGGLGLLVRFPGLMTVAGGAAAAAYNEYQRLKEGRDKGYAGEPLTDEMLWDEAQVAAGWSVAADLSIPLLAKSGKGLLNLVGVIERKYAGGTGSFFGVPAKMRLLMENPELRKELQASLDFLSVENQLKSGVSPDEVLHPTFMEALDDVIRRMETSADITKRSQWLPDLHSIRDERLKQINKMGEVARDTFNELQRVEATVAMTPKAESRLGSKTAGKVSDIQSYYENRAAVTTRRLEKTAQAGRTTTRDKAATSQTLMNRYVKPQRERLEQDAYTEMNRQLDKFSRLGDDLFKQDTGANLRTVIDDFAQASYDPVNSNMGEWSQYINRQWRNFDERVSPEFAGDTFMVPRGFAKAVKGYRELLNEKRIPEAYDHLDKFVSTLEKSVDNTGRPLADPMSFGEARQFYQDLHSVINYLSADYGPGAGLPGSKEVRDITDQYWRGFNRQLKSKNPKAFEEFQELLTKQENFRVLQRAKIVNALSSKSSLGIIEDAEPFSNLLFNGSPQSIKKNTREIVSAFHNVNGNPISGWMTFQDNYFRVLSNQIHERFLKPRQSEVARVGAENLKRFDSASMRAWLKEREEAITYVLGKDKYKSIYNNVEEIEKMDSMLVRQIKDFEDIVNNALPVRIFKGTKPGDVVDAIIDNNLSNKEILQLKTNIQKAPYVKGRSKQTGASLWREIESHYISDRIKPGGFWRNPDGGLDYRKILVDTDTESPGSVILNSDYLTALRDAAQRVENLGNTLTGELIREAAHPVRSVARAYVGIFTTEGRILTAALTLANVGTRRRWERALLNPEAAMLMAQMGKFTPRQLIFWRTLNKISGITHQDLVGDIETMIGLTEQEALGLSDAQVNDQENRLVRDQVKAEKIFDLRRKHNLYNVFDKKKNADESNKPDRVYEIDEELGIARRKKGSRGE